MPTARRIRSEVSTKVRWNQSGSIHEGRSRNLSVNGVYVLCDKKPDIDLQFEIELSLPGASTDMSIAITGRVIRHDDSGFAMSFDGVESESYEHLKNLVAYQNRDPEEVFKEQRLKPGIKA